jgi:hypothetical protein
MIAALILVAAAAGLLQFFISYNRSLIAASRTQELSGQAREVIGIEGQGVRGEEFWSLLQLIRLCPAADDPKQLRVVCWYFDLLGLVRRLGRPLSPGVARWAELEREGCAYFAAVELDRRMAYSRVLMAQQMSGSA